MADQKTTVKTLLLSKSLRPGGIVTSGVRLKLVRWSQSRDFDIRAREKFYEREQRRLEKSDCEAGVSADRKPRRPATKKAESTNPVKAREAKR
jgi:hypothetical protein